MERLESAAKEAGPDTIGVACDVTSADSCHSAIERASAHLGGIDALIYTPAIGPLGSLVDTDAETWRSVFDTNVIGAALVTASAVTHLEQSGGVAIFLSSVSASITPPWPGLGAYAVSKAALDKLVEAWRVEHSSVAFTRLVVGDCAGGEGESMTEFANTWESDRATLFFAQWVEKNYLAGSLLDVNDLISVVDSLVQQGASASIPSLAVVPRGPTPA
jgi:NAD(P)-dependent dehydrogenase (short-subunit alcohol dehydrogenase family)